MGGFPIAGEIFTSILALKGAVMHVAACFARSAFSGALSDTTQGASSSTFLIYRRLSSHYAIAFMLSMQYGLHGEGGGEGAEVIHHFLFGNDLFWRSH